MVQVLLLWVWLAQSSAMTAAAATWQLQQQHPQCMSVQVLLLLVWSVPWLAATAITP
jgi:hypothetical protein